jgi:hypothetical protein
MLELRIVIYIILIAWIGACCTACGPKRDHLAKVLPAEIKQCNQITKIGAFTRIYKCDFEDNLCYIINDSEGVAIDCKFEDKE